MGFFKDFKNDISQAVNELSDEAVGMATDTEAAAEDTAEDVMVNTLDSEDDTALAADLEAMLAADPAPVDEEPAVKTATKKTKPVAEEPVAAPVIEKEPVVIEPVEAEPEEVNEPEDSVSDETAIITPGLRIRGDIESIGSIELLGTVEGNVTCRGKLVASGSITGNTQSSEFFSDKAKINGDINCDGPAKIGNGSVVKGNLAATSAVIAGAIKGDIDVHGPVIIDTSAIVIGDIKSKSVQINNGAVIDGRVSQCYAEIKPVTIFGEE